MLHKNDKQFIQAQEMKPMAKRTTMSLKKSARSTMPAFIHPPLSYLERWLTCTSLGYLP